MDDSYKKRPAPWPIITSEARPDLPLVTVRFDTVRNPRTDKEVRAVIFDSPPWVNVVAMTPERRLVVVRQYRFGIGAVTTEVPGGLVDPGENHGDAAVRELREETGYTTTKWTYLGASEPNPAVYNTLLHHWLAEDALATHPLGLDEHMTRTQPHVLQVAAVDHGLLVSLRHAMREHLRSAQQNQRHSHTFQNDC